MPRLSISKPRRATVNSLFARRDPTLRIHGGWNADAATFKNCVGQIIETAGLNAASGQPRKVRIFAEMVNLLYGAGNIPAATRLDWPVHRFLLILRCTDRGVGPANHADKWNADQGELHRRRTPAEGCKLGGQGADVGPRAAAVASSPPYR
jgi:hypothetical protein